MDTPPISSSVNSNQKIQDQNSRASNANDSLEQDAVNFQQLLNEGKSQQLSLAELQKYLANRPNLKELEQLLLMLQTQKGSESLVQAVLNQIAVQKGDSSGVSSTDAPKGADAKLTTLVEKIVAQIHVMDPKSISDKPAVLISFNDSVLQASQVLLSRTNGVLQVAFQTSAFDSVQFLNQNQANLQQTLANRLNEPVAVTVNGTMTGTSAQQNEGRSKGQYIPEPEAQDLTS